MVMVMLLCRRWSCCCVEGGHVVVLMLVTGLVFMGGDSCSNGRGFESKHHTLDGHFSHLFVVKIVMFV